MLNFSISNSKWHFQYQTLNMKIHSKCTQINPKQIEPKPSQNVSENLNWKNILPFCIESHHNDYLHLHIFYTTGIPISVILKMSCAVIEKTISLSNIAQLFGLVCIPHLCACFWTSRKYLIDATPIASKWKRTLPISSISDYHNDDWYVSMKTIPYILKNQFVIQTLGEFWLKEFIFLKY